MTQDKEAVKVLAEEMMKAVRAIIQDNNKNYVNNQIKNHGGGIASKLSGSITASQVRGLGGAVAGFLTSAINGGKQEASVVDKAIYDAILNLAEIEINSITADTGKFEHLYATIGDFINIMATNATITDLTAKQFQADIARLGIADIGSAKIKYSQITNLDADTAFIRQGVEDQVYIDNLAVTEGNILALSVGKLMIKDGNSGQMVQLAVDPTTQQVITVPVSFDGEDIINDGSIGTSELHDLAITTSKIANNAVTGDKIIAGSILTKHLDASEIFAKDANIMDLIASNIKVSQLFANTGVVGDLSTSVIHSVDFGNALNISGNSSITLANDYIGLVIDKDETDLEKSSLVLTDTMLAVTADKIDLRANKSVTSRIADSMYHRIITQPEEPEDPEFQMIWANNGVVPTEYKQWNGHEWSEIDGTSIDSNSILLNALIQDMSTKISQTNDRILLEVTEEENAIIKGELENLSKTVSQIDQKADSINLTVSRQRSVYVQEDTPMVAKEGDVWRDPNSPDYFIAGTSIEDEGFEFAYDDEGNLLYAFEEGHTESHGFKIEDDDLVISYDAGVDEEGKDKPIETVYHMTHTGVLGNWKIVKNIAFSNLQLTVDGIYSTVFKYDPETGEYVSVVEQSAEKIDWMVTKTTEEGSETSKMSLTSEALTAIANDINLSANHTMTFNAAQLEAIAENIDLSANESINVKAKNLSQEALQSILIHVDNSVLEITEGKISTTVGSLRQIISDAKIEFETKTKVITIDDDGLHIGDKDSSNCEVLIDTDSVNVVTNGQMESKFTGSYIQFGNYQLRRTADGGLAFKIKE